MHPYPSKQVTYDFLKALVAERVAEDKFIEYKLTLPGESDKKEFLADISAFANAHGGMVVYGVKEERDDRNQPTGLPEQLVGLGDINVDKEILRLEQIFLTGIQPKIPGVRILPVVGDGKTLIVIQISQSWLCPHMVTHGGSQRFFVRTNNGKAPLDVHELRQLFLQSGAFADRAREFRTQRLGKILAADTPIPLQDGSLVILHLIPISTFTSSVPIDISPFLVHHQQLCPLMGPKGRGQHGRPNLDGYVAYYDYSDKPQLAYTQVFRNGVIEIVDAEIQQVWDENYRDKIRSITLENNVQRTLVDSFETYQRLGVEPPISVMLTLLHVRDHRMDPGNGRHVLSLPTVDREHVILPDVLVQDTSLPIDQILKPVFDLLWQAFGLHKCDHYGTDGKWLAPRG